MALVLRRRAGFGLTGVCAGALALAAPWGAGTARADGAHAGAAHAGHGDAGHADHAAHGEAAAAGAKAPAATAAAARPVLAATAGRATIETGRRAEWTHASRGPHASISGPAVAALPGGRDLIAWFAAEGDANALYVAAPGTDAPAVRVDPPGRTVDSLHQPPALAAGAGDAVFVSWSSGKPKPAGVLFASDLQVARSSDGGRTFAAPVRVNEDRAISHSFDGLAVSGGGEPIVAWIDGRDGEGKAATFVARLDAGATAVASTQRLGDDTCVCCRVDVAARGERAAALWRKDFPGHVRDMVLAFSDDGGARFAAPAQVHDDHWVMPGCPHRGGSAGIDGAGRVYAAWYTEGRDGLPALLFGTSSDGVRFDAPVRLDASSGSIPDHVRLAVDAAGRLIVAWEESTAVRRRIVARASADGGKSFGPLTALSTAMKAYEPAIAVVPSGGFAVAWNEERFPRTLTIVQHVAVGTGGSL